MEVAQHVKVGGIVFGLSPARIDSSVAGVGGFGESQARHGALIRYFDSGLRLGF